MFTTKKTLVIFQLFAYTIFVKKVNNRWGNNKMKRILAAALSFTLIAGASFAHTDTAEAKTKIKAYPNCKALNKDYKGGVAKSKTTKNKGGKTHYKPYASKDLYNKNKGRDRDKDGIACER